MITLSTSNQAGLANQASSAQSNTAKSIETISSGSRLSRASSDIASFGIASRLKAEITHNDQAIKNAADAQSLLQTADSGLGEIQTILQELRSVSVQSMNGTYSSTDTEAMNTHAQQLLAEIDSIASSTKWAGSGLLDGNSAYLNFTTGEAATDGNGVTATVPGFKAANLGLTNLTLDGNNIHESALEVSDEFRVNTTSVGKVSQMPESTVLTNGNLLIAWQRYDGVYGQIYESNGNALGSEITLVSDSEQNGSSRQSVVATDDGGFMVAYNHANSSVKLRKFDATGNLLSVDSQFGSGQIIKPSSAASLSNTDSVVVFTQDRAVVGQLVNEDGGLIGSTFLINESIEESLKFRQQSPIVAASEAGGFFAVWQSENSAGTYDVVGQLFDNSGKKIGSKVTVETQDDNATSPFVEALENGHYVVSWGTSGGQIHAKIFDESASPITETIEVNDTATKPGHHANVVVNALVGNDFAVSWASTDSSPGYLFGQRFNALGEKQGSAFSIQTSAFDGFNTNGITGVVNNSGQLMLSWSNDYTLPPNTTKNVHAKIISPYETGETSKLNMIDDAIAYIVRHRATLGANINRLSSAISNLTTLSHNKKASLGTVADADMATEVTQLAKTQLLAQASVAMTAQANNSMYEVLKLIKD